MRRHDVRRGLHLEGPEKAVQIRRAEGLRAEKLPEAVDGNAELAEIAAAELDELDVLCPNLRHEVDQPVDLRVLEVAQFLELRRSGGSRRALWRRLSGLRRWRWRCARIDVHEGLKHLVRRLGADPQAVPRREIQNDAVSRIEAMHHDHELRLA